VLWDGASYQPGADRQTFLAPEHVGLAEAEWQVTCLLFAPTAPAHNPTEDFWLKGKMDLRKHCAVNKPLAAVTQCFSTFLPTLSFASTKFSWYWPTPQPI